MNTLKAGDYVEANGLIVRLVKPLSVDPNGNIRVCGHRWIKSQRRFAERVTSFVIDEVMERQIAHTGFSPETACFWPVVKNQQPIRAAQ
jgi:hypothetical protein